MPDGSGQRVLARNLGEGRGPVRHVLVTSKLVGAETCRAILSRPERWGPMKLPEWITC